MQGYRYATPHPPIPLSELQGPGYPAENTLQSETLHRWRATRLRDHHLQEWCTCCANVAFASKQQLPQKGLLLPVSHGRGLPQCLHLRKNRTQATGISIVAAEDFPARRFFANTRGLYITEPMDEETARAKARNLMAGVGERLSCVASGPNPNALHPRT